MLFKEKFIDGIRRGAITVTFRRWRSARVRVDGSYRVRPDVMLRVRSIRIVEPSAISARDAKRAGFDSKAALLTQLQTPGTLYRVAFETTTASPDPRAELAKQKLTEDSYRRLAKKLDAMDARTATGPWTQRALALIGTHEARRAADLAPGLDLDTATFKTRIRRLKALGLTASLDTGYALTPRGQQYLERRGK